MGASIANGTLALFDSTSCRHDLARFEFVRLVHAGDAALADDVQNPIVRLVGRLAGEVLAGKLLGARALAGRRIDPEDVVAVLLDGELQRAGLLDVDEVLGVFERHGAAAIDIEVGLELPVARVGEQIEPDGHRLGVRGVRRARDAGVLAVHGGVPEAFAEGGGVVLRGAHVHERHAVELVFDRR